MRLVGLGLGLVSVIVMWSLQPPPLIGLLAEFALLVVLISVFGVKHVH